MLSNRTAPAKSIAVSAAVTGSNALIQTVNALRDIDELSRIEAFLTTLDEHAILTDPPEITVQAHLQPLEASRAYSGGAFNRLFRVLVHPATNIEHIFKNRKHVIFCGDVVRF